MIDVSATGQLAAAALAATCSTATAKYETKRILTYFCLLIHYAALSDEDLTEIDSQRDALLCIHARL